MVASQPVFHKATTEASVP